MRRKPSREYNGPEEGSGQACASTPALVIIPRFRGPRPNRRSVVLASLLLFTGGAAENFASTSDPVSQGIVATTIVLVFAFLVIETAHRVLVVFSAAALLLAISYLTPY